MAAALAAGRPQAAAPVVAWIAATGIEDVTLQALAARVAEAVHEHLGRLLLAVLWLAATPALAHKPSDAYLTLRFDGGTLAGQWDVALRDLEHAIGLDADGDGAVTWGELADRERALRSLCPEPLDDHRRTRPLPAVAGGAAGRRAHRRCYAVLWFAAACPAGASGVAINYRLFADLDPLHRGLLRVEDGDVTRTAVLGPDAPNVAFARSAPADLLGQALVYVQDGVGHIFLGYDHVLFLLTLLLPAVVRRELGSWQPVSGFGTTAVEAAKVVTAFTVAHSITLLLATLGLVDLSSQLVESAIAATIVLAALNNLYPVVTRRMWLVAFAFGLVHRLGFASALAALGLPPRVPCPRCSPSISASSSGSWRSSPCSCRSRSPAARPRFTPPGDPGRLARDRGAGWRLVHEPGLRPRAGG